MSLLRTFGCVSIGFSFLTGCAAGPGPDPVVPGQQPMVGEVAGETVLPPPAPAAPPAPAMTAPTANGSEGNAAGVRYVEYVTGGAQMDDALPMIIVLHGGGGNGEHVLQHFFANYPERARIIGPYGEPAGRGHQWWLRSHDQDVLAQRIPTAEVRVAPMIAELLRSRPTVGRPILVGLSQGGMLSFLLAVRHPELISEAFPVSGQLPLQLIPSQPLAGRPPVPIHAFHGDADKVVAVDLDRSTVDRLRASGFPVELFVYPGGAHIPGADEVRDVRNAVSAAIQRVVASSQPAAAAAAPAAAPAVGLPPPLVPLAQPPVASPAVAAPPR